MMIIIIVITNITLLAIASIITNVTSFHIPHLTFITFHLSESLSVVTLCVFVIAVFVFLCVIASAVQI